jgi:hypothetical protein
MDGTKCLGAHKLKPLRERSVILYIMGFDPVVIVNVYSKKHAET